MSKFFTLSTRDLIKGAVVAVLTGIMTFLVEQLKADTAIDLLLLKQVGISGLIAFLAYLIKNLVTNSNDEILKPDKK